MFIFDIYDIWMRVTYVSIYRTKPWSRYSVDYTVRKTMQAVKYCAEDQIWLPFMVIPK